jgi:hypothetical protein
MSEPISGASTIHLKLLDSVCGQKQGQMWNLNRSLIHPAYRAALLISMRASHETMRGTHNFYVEVLARVRVI